MHVEIRGRWLTDVGLPFDDATSALAHRLAERVEQLDGWDAAVRLSQDPRTLPAWEDERLAEAALKARSDAPGATKALHAALTPVVDAGREVFFGAALHATRQAGLDDPYLVRVAAGAVSQAAYQNALARATGADDHPFVQKYALFERGRWVVGKIARTLYVF
jgi:hypothetical protein